MTLQYAEPAGLMQIWVGIERNRHAPRASRQTDAIFSEWTCAEAPKNVERWLKGTVEEPDRLLTAKNMLGDPIEKENATVFPIVRNGFGFGAGGGANGKAGDGTGTGASGGIEPLGAIIIDSDGTRVSQVRAQNNP